MVILIDGCAKLWYTVIKSRGGVGMQSVTNVETMRKSDAEAIHSGTTGIELMRRAGEGIFHSYAWRGPVAIVCGSGNNAGDGYVLATLLDNTGIDCTLFLLSDHFSPDGAYYYEKCKEIGIKTECFTEKSDLSGYAEIVDCMFGTGFRGEVKGLAATAIERINESRAFVISVDINSGLNGDNGTYKTCVCSDLTVSVGTYKSGHFLNGAKDVIGATVNVDIGIPISGVCYKLIEKKDLKAVLKPRLQDSHKGSYGYVSLIGGCTSYAGAVKLANLSCAALRAGCGVAQLAVPASLAKAVLPYLLESTLALLPDRDGQMIYNAQALDGVLAKQKAVAIGMGWGSSPEYHKILAHILQAYAFTVVIDADGLNTLAGMDQTILEKSACSILLTPHPMEMSRLSGCSIEEIRNDPIGVAERYARAHHVTVLLKGACSVVTDGKETYLANRGCAGMATAGSGDVLSGILVGLLGYNTLSPFTAACGAYLAGLAGELAEADVNPISMLASDTVAHIPGAISSILNA